MLYIVAVFLFQAEVTESIADTFLHNELYASSCWCVFVFMFYTKNRIYSIRYVIVSGATWRLALAFF